MSDQANRLRQEVMKRIQPEDKLRRTRVIAVTSGKGGVGKSNVSLNFALSLAALDKKVMIFDLDVGMANIDVLMGVTPKETLVSMLEKNLTLDAIIQKGVNGLQYISGGNGIGKVFSLDGEQLNHFFNEFNVLQGMVDYIILDTGAGLTQEGMRFLQAADDVFLVINPEPPSITDAYGVLKALHARDPKLPVKLIINRAISDQEAGRTAHNFQQASEKFLNKTIDILGWIPDDVMVRKAVMAQSPYLLEYPNAKASEAITQLVHTYLDLPSTYKLGVKGFLTKMLFHK
ncbi:MinD/ParA family protein [Pseudalkalibacillus hwajinpoensis]|uniref:MinD/ParA family protein n=1 Tax=Guptibacillus hwajinpoensis TaxID=208199 RepID=A0A4U1MHU0_9BACL|nr:MinD/ParA family protein [Pseudalkalibacillus hwajinpoensis]TKD70563.1 MinD/ParA family protein [Pseudalkalibacillus hwajinpoensis]